MHILNKRIISILVGFSLVGCTNFAPDFKLPELTISNSISGDNSELLQDDLELQAWQDFFKGDTVKELINSALENNKDLKIAAANISEARGRYGIQQSNEVPGFGINSNNSTVKNSVNLSGSDSISRNYNVNLGLLSYELDFWGRVKNLEDSALANYFASLEAHRSIKLSLISETAKSYYNYLSAKNNLALAKQTNRARTKSLELIQLRKTVGIASDLDLTQAEVAKSTVETKQSQAERTLVLYKSALQLLIGQPLENILPESLESEELFNLEIPANISSDVLLNRPDIIAKEESLYAANANIGAARAAFFPQINIVAGAGVASSSLGSLFKSGSGTWNFSPIISMPLFGNATSSQLEVAKARQNIAIAEYEKAIEVAFSEVYKSLINGNIIKKEIATNKKLVSSQTKRLKLAKARYNAGLSSYIEVLDAQQDLFTAEQLLLETARLRIEEVIQLYKSLGGGDDFNSTFRQEYYKSEIERIERERNKDENRFHRN